MLIQRQKSLLLVVDLQEKLAPAIFEGERAIRNSVRLLDGARQLGVPAFISEQYVRGLGHSVEAVRNAATIETEAGPRVNAKFFEKTHFSCTAEAGVTELLQAAQRPQVILTGTETHVCVLQTAMGLLAAGFSVFLVADAASSRSPANHDAAVERLRAAGGNIVTTEMAVLEREVGKHPRYSFTYRGQPIGGQVSNTAWQNAVAEAGIKDLRFHDLRHT